MSYVAGWIDDPADRRHTYKLVEMNGRWGSSHDQLMEWVDETWGGDLYIEFEGPRYALVKTTVRPALAVVR